MTEPALRGTLLEIVTTLEALEPTHVDEPGATIYAEKPWTADSPAAVLRQDPIDGVAPGFPTHAYFLEVEIAKEALGVWSSWREGATPTADEATRAVIHYAEYDAYEPVE